MIDCPLFNYCNGDCRQCTDEIKQQKIKEVEMEFALGVKVAINALVPVVADCVRAFTDFATSMYKQYPNKRIVWLALYHPKSKVRKKNKSRIIKYFKKIF